MTTSRLLGEIIDNFDSLRVPITSSKRTPGPYPYYGASGVVDHVESFIFDGPYLLIAEDGENLRARSTPVAFMVDGQFWVNNHAHVVRGKTGICDTQFLSYYLSVTDISGYLSGSAQPKLSQASLNSIRIQLPPLPEQQAIAEVLGALDDKIAANRKLVTTSLCLAQALHDQVVTAGDVTAALYTDVAEVGGGATPKTRVPEYWDGDIHWASPTDITALGAPYLHDTSRHITQAGLDSCSSPLYPEGSILMTSRATIGAFAVAQEPTAVNQGFIVLIPKREELRWWLLHDMMGRVKEFQNRANGATFLELSKRTFKTMEFDLPSDTQLLRFDESARALHEHAIALGQESRTLAQLRDTLLPALMDGTIRVKDAEKLTEEAV
ncbi:restriction endonuclease subunit S [Corynebacterium variabile]|uniref:restriction endonuclease subunit S n=1 Tax=Corynebacterium variabile TaxID=1727 RepID=UPI002649E172|nr:restriction endonuclease subunit S [Corynebacterium variabile]MDN6478392.1 restriction endonuclease subunit S [Corynebacterium variabile]MDN6556121.1 restriction endonuclease subunit S [Acidipropionibacterium acidipropionici]